MRPFSLSLISTCLLTVFFSEEVPIYHNGFGYSCKDAVLNCLQDKCLINLTMFLCTECTSGHVPINGKCVSIKDQASTGSVCVKSPTGGWCTKCNGDYFLFYGGCYNLDSPWKTICHRAENGLCKECGKGVEGYPSLVFTNPNATSLERCIHCGDPIGFGGHSGVYNCQQCSQPRLSGRLRLIVRRAQIQTCAPLIIDASLLLT